MRQVASISLDIVHEATKTSDTWSEVLLDNKRTGIVVRGRVLDAAVQVDDMRYVLFLSEGVIFETCLTVALIDIHEGIVEDFWLGGFFADGFLEDFNFTENTIQFKFFGDFIWKLKISKHPRWRLPFFFRPDWCTPEDGTEKVYSH